MSLIKFSTFDLYSLPMARLFLKRLSMKGISQFLARGSSALLCYRPSVSPSVTRVDQSKTVKDRITQPSQPSSPHDCSFLTLNFTMKFQREDRERGRQIREG